MKKYFLSIVALVATLFLAGCQNDEDYLNVIPADAQFVTSIDLQSVAEDADLANKNIAATVDGTLGLVVKGQDLEKIKGYISEPEKMGIDFREPVYAFMIPKTYENACFGAVMKVLKESDLEAFIATLAEQNLCTKPTKKDGRMSGTLLDAFDYSYDGTSLLVLSARNPKETKKMMPKLLAQSADESFVGTPEFEKMNDKDGAIKVYLSTPFEKIGFTNGNFAMVSALDFDNGKATMQYEAWGKTEKDQKIIDDAYANMKRLNGEFSDDMPDDFLAWVSAGVNGEWLLGKLKENKTTKEYLFALERAIDIEQMLRAVDGDMTCVVIPSENSKLEFGDYTVMAQIKNTDFMKDVDYWTKSMADYGMSMTRIEDDHYLLNAGDMQLHWGIDSDRDELYFETPAAFDKMKLAADNDVLHDYVEDIERSYAYIYINMENNASRDLYHGVFKTFDIVDKAKSIVIKSQQVGEVEIDIELKNKDKNFLAQMLEFLN